MWHNICGYSHAVTSTMLLLTESTLSFVNLLVDDYESTSKQSLAGTVKGWATGVHDKTSPGSVKASTDMTTLVSAGALHSQPKQVTMNTQTITHWHGSEMDPGIATKFGGFDLDDNDNEEREVMLLPKDNIALVRALLFHSKLFTKLTALGCSLHS